MTLTPLNTKAHNFPEDGYSLIRGLVPQNLLHAVETELLLVSRLLDRKFDFQDLDECWNYFKRSNRQLAAK